VILQNSVFFWTFLPPSKKKKKKKKKSGKAKLNGEYLQNINKNFFIYFFNPQILSKGLEIVKFG
jgi:hypothetical protein